MADDIFGPLIAGWASGVATLVPSLIVVQPFVDIVERVIGTKRQHTCVGVRIPIPIRDPPERCNYTSALFRRLPLQGIGRGFESLCAHFSSDVVSGPEN